jgi:hypothetical protein
VLEGKVSPSSASGAEMDSIDLAFHASRSGLWDARDQVPRRFFGWPVIDCTSESNRDMRAETIEPFSFSQLPFGTGFTAVCQSKISIDIRDNLLDEYLTFSSFGLMVILGTRTSISFFDKADQLPQSNGDDVTREKDQQII